MLTGIPEIQQDGLMDLADFTIETGSNLLVIGPAGSGKTEISLQRVANAKRRGLYLNLSVIEAPDLVGLMERHEGRTRYCVPDKFRVLTPEDEGKDDGDVLVVDELDKARPELQNPMLELFQYRSINGTKLNIKAVISTANLPDENAFSRAMSHALTNRGFVYRMNCVFEPWMKWAVDSQLNGLIVGFLSRHPTMLLQPPPKDDATAYLHPSPRSWVLSARALDAAANRSVEQQTLLVAGCVGTSAAATFQVWLQHYREISPIIDSLVRYGRKPTDSELGSLDRIFVCGIAAANTIVEITQRIEAGKAKHEELVKATDNIMKWIKDVPTEYSIGALKSVLSIDLITQYELMKIPSFMEVFVAIRKSWDLKK
jgi:hypothetical protein